jgi:hypothetical protein
MILELSRQNRGLAIGLRKIRYEAGRSKKKRLNTGPSYGEGVSTYRPDPFYHASLDAVEYEHLLPLDSN